MIIVNLKGGLGNQMFQYACGRALSLRMKERGEDGTLKLDATGFDRITSGETVRTFDLRSFNVDAPLASADEILRIKYPFGSISKAWRLFKAKVLRKFYINFDPAVLDRRGDVYLDGFWQTEDYFKDFEKAIRDDFTLAKPPGATARDWFKAITENHNAVSLHVRRGDYVSDKATGEHHGTCDAKYYERALMDVAEKMDDRARVRGVLAVPSLYVFSDDIEWARRNLSFPCPTAFVSSPDMTPAEEMALMSACQHHIIANSTFSWWGAWLGQNPEKIVVAPKRWANEHNDDWYKDLIPPSWTRL